ncbi:hypothetical protein [Nesterenkonia sp. CL21]|uniref:hypothetical protein n=1 Tax=unclassified Nesterenkonia TaxID=2629769 RepID=UPI0008729DF4|nr:hypothetical protein [Nesterenkonia sp. CL21]MDS2172051.1 hypothetical protein [Nesterenkonia sp. CL21]
MTETTQDPTEGDSPETPVLQLTGTPLGAEELAAVAAVVGRLATAEPVEDADAGGTGPRDRTLQRRRHLGLWGRPGTDSWQHAAGLR